MQHINDHALNVDDNLFYERIMAELVNIDVKMKPILHKNLSFIEEIQKLRTELAALCSPTLINYKKTLEDQNSLLMPKCVELEATEKEVDDTCYEAVVLSTDIQNSHKI